MQSKLPRVLLTSAAGSPTDPRVWSGTPHKVYRNLLAAGKLDVMPFSSLSAERAFQLTDRALALRHSFIPGPARRLVSARRVKTEARRQDCAAQLHLGHYDAPIFAGARPTYIYIDNTYELWERHALPARRLSAHQKRWYRWLDTRALQHAQHIFTAGEHVVESLVQHMGVPRERITAVGTGIGDIQPFHGVKDYGNGKLLIVAKIRPKDKGLPILLDALAVARHQRPDLTLTVIGGAKFPELCNQPGVTATGWISAEELQNLFEEASLYIMPATYEPWGLSYLEALICRIPVMGLDRGALPEITANGRHGFLLKEPNAQELATAILGALADPVRLAKMGLAGQQYCLERYDWQRLAARISTRIIQDLGSG